MYCPATGHACQNPGCIDDVKVCASWLTHFPIDPKALLKDQSEQIDRLEARIKALEDVIKKNKLS